MSIHEEIPVGSPEGEYAFEQSTRIDTCKNLLLARVLVDHYDTNHKGEGFVRTLINHYVALERGELRLEDLT